MNEFELIAQLTQGLPANDAVVLGPGDDCAVLDLGQPDRWTLFKTDAVVAGVHFAPEAKGEQVGHKALGRCLSDIAAMGGTPVAAVVTLGLPREYNAEFVKCIYAGLNALASRHGVAVVGGETVTSPERLFLSLALVGWVPRERRLFRSGAKDGDALFVTGELGGSLTERHLHFEPRLAEGRWLAERGVVHAMIDISDGLAGDLRHILHRSGVGAEILARAIPVSRAAKLQAKSESSAKPPLLAALTDGEDFELLFTVAGREAVSLLDAWKEKFPSVRLSCIGKITAAPGLRIRDEHGVRALEAHGYMHFA